MSNRFFITFGFGQPLENCYAIVPGEFESSAAAREKIAETYGSQFAFQYDLDDLPNHAKYGIREVAWGTPNALDIRCQGCKLTPGELTEYVEAAQDCDLTPEQYVRMEEGTFNPANGHFLCTACYIDAGEPSSPEGWKCP